MKAKQYKSIIHCITVDINPLLHDVLYMIEYTSGKVRYIFQNELSFDVSQRIHNFINTGILTFNDCTISVYKAGQQNVIN